MCVDREGEEIRAQLGRAFPIARVPTGWAVSTPMQRSDGDRFAFYLRPTENGWAVEDDGGSVPHYVAVGNDFGPGSDAVAFVRGSGVDYDEEGATLFVEVPSLHEVRSASMRLLGVLCRLHFESLGLKRHFSPLVTRSAI